MADSVRPVPYNSHPVIAQTYIVPTPSIDDAFAALKKCIRHKTPGVLLVGMSRFGKTYGARYMAVALREETAGLVVILYVCEKKKRPVESAFFENLLDFAGHTDCLSGTTNAKRKRLKNYLIEKVRRSGLNLLIFFADEAHRLEPIEYEWLHDLHSNLEQAGIRMITLLVGNQKLLHQKNAFKAQGETAIIGRFMIDEIPFRGVRSASDVATCLAAYDEATYPQGSEWTYTRFFFPRSYDAGLRLASCASDLWNAFWRAHMTARFAFEIDIPMQYFSRTVEIALTDNSALDSETFVFTPALWDEAVLNSKYVIAIEEMRMSPEADD